MSKRPFTRGMPKLQEPRNFAAPWKPDESSSIRKPMTIGLTTPTEEPPTPEKLYEVWRQDRTPENGHKLLSSLDSAIAASTRKYVKDANPVALGRARSLVIAALPRYDSSRGVSLATYVDRQLQPLQRWSARKNIGVRVPTRDVQLRKVLDEHYKQLEDDLGRAPSIQELADYSGVPYDSITKLNRQTYPQIAERELSTDDGSTMTAGDQAVQSGDSDLWLRAVYHDLTPIDQFIMQHTMGIYGARPMSNTEIAKKLKITPGAVSQRKAKIDGYLESVQ